MTLFNSIIRQANHNKATAPGGIYLNGNCHGLQSLYCSSVNFYKHILFTFGSISRNQSEPWAMIFCWGETRTK